jgi:serine/threonine protein phosphatase 1
MKLTREVLQMPRAVAANEELVAIGDIHGRPDLLDALLAHVARTPIEGATRRIVFLGDLVDRGPDSLGALELAASAAGRTGAAETIGLYGNHEILMRLALDPATPAERGLAALQVWLGNGGSAVVEQLVGPRSSGPRRLLAELRAATPDWVRDWLGSLRPHAVSGDVLFVHAGVNPKLPLAGFLARPWDEPLDKLEERAHWAWVRGPFLDHRPGERGFSGYFVVHGHTPLDRGHTKGHSEQAQRFRLNLDGGSAATGQAKLAFLRGGVAEVVTAQA